MAKISNKKIYNDDLEIRGDEHLIGTDPQDFKRTKNYTIDKIADFIAKKIGNVDEEDEDEGGYKNDDGTYTWVAYAEDIEGTNMTFKKGLESNFIGYAFNKESSEPSEDPTEYIWVPLTFEKGRDGIDGANGIDGLDGTDGLPGPPGIDGKTTYFHVAYADDDKGTNFTQHPYDKKWLGTYSDYTATDSNNWQDYEWVEVKGLDGAKGIPGYNATDGLTYYLHIAYAESSDGSVGFDVVESEGKNYIGTLVDLIEDDSLVYSDYDWALILNPENGVPDGDGTYTWTKYTLTLDGLSPLVDTEDGMKYRGFAFKKPTPIESNNIEDYQWHLIYKENAVMDQNNKIKTITIPEDELDSFDAEGFSDWFKQNEVSVEEDEILVLEIGESTSSGGGTVSPPIYVTPTLDDEPLDLSAGAATKTTIPLSWDINGENAITKFELYYIQTTENSVAKMIPISNRYLTSYTLEDLPSGTTYEIYLKAYDTKGNSKTSNLVYASTLSDYISLTPQLFLLEQGETELKVGWGIEESFLADRYELYLDNVKVYDGGLTEYTATGLTEGTDYVFKLQAFKDLTSSVIITETYSTIQETGGTVTPLTPPVISFIKSKEVEITFNASIPALERPRVGKYELAYRVFRNTEPKNSWIDRELPDLASIQQLNGLTENTTYEFVIRSVNLDGTLKSDWSNTLIETTLNPNEGIYIALSSGPLTLEQLNEGYIGVLNIYGGETKEIVKISVTATVFKNTDLSQSVGGGTLTFDKLTGPVTSIREFDVFLDKDTSDFISAFKFDFVTDLYGFTIQVDVQILEATSNIVVGSATKQFTSNSTTDPGTSLG